jgi:DNA-binding transcriptional LysR family regulator
MDRLNAMRVFARVIDEGGFAAAARRLNLSPAVVTRQVADLEEHLGARLMNRTTRRIALTDTGEAYLERVRQILSEVDEAEALATAATAEPRGALRVITAPSVAVHQLAKHLPRFHALYPKVSIELTAVGAVETADENHDVSILNLRNPPNGEFIARQLARSEIILCAAPEYLAQRGRPAHPRELLTHDMLIPPVSEVTRGVTFRRGTAGESHALVPGRHPVLSSTNTDVMYASVLAGLGIAGLPSFVVEDALLEHALERVVPQWRLFDTRLWVAMPTRKHVPARTRVFVDFLLQTFGGEDRDPWLSAAGCATPP